MNPTKKREAAYDVLRILCAFLVIVNHTNSLLFKAAKPEQGVWWFSIIWYYISKAAVPVFVMISGACLLDRADSVKRSVWRVLRMVLVLLVFSYGYYLYDAWVNYGLWPRAVQFKAFFKLLLQNGHTDAFWYLYFYIALMILLPFLQRAVRGMSQKALWAFVALCFAWDGLVPLIAHYLPVQWQLNEFITLPPCTGYLGLFGAGYLLRNEKRVRVLPCVLAMLVSLAACVVLTRIEYDQTVGAHYWFMDDRMHPALLVCMFSMALFVLFKKLLNGKQSSRLLCELGACSLAVYLVQDWVIAESRTRIFQYLIDTFTAVPAMLLWEVIVFAVCLIAALILRRIPLLKKLL